MLSLSVRSSFGEEATRLLCTVQVVPHVTVIVLSRGLSGLQPRLRDVALLNAVCDIFCVHTEEYTYAFQSKTDNRSFSSSQHSLFFLGSPGASLPSMTFHIQSRANRDSPQCVFQAPDHGRTQEPFCRCSIQVASQGSPIEEVLGRHRPTHNCHQPTFRLCRNFIRGALRFLGTVYPFMTEGGAVPTALSSCWKCSLRRVT